MTSTEGDPLPGIVREPFRPSQAQTEVTRAITGIRLDLELCGICSNNRGVGDHHLTFRSRGGEQGPTIPVCVACHDRVHRGDWVLKISKRDGLEVFDKEGQLIWRLKRWPLPGEPGDLVQLLENVIQVEALMPDLAPALLPWQAIEVFNGLRATCDSGWRAQMRLLGEFYEYRLPGVSQPDKILALTQLFALRKSQVYNHLQVHEAFRESPLLDATPLAMGYAIEASRTEDPESWLKFAEDRKMEHPLFSRDDLRLEIIRADARRYKAPEGAGTGVSRVWAKCSSCGVADWHEKLPIGSTGELADLPE